MNITAQEAAPFSGEPVEQDVFEPQPIVFQEEQELTKPKFSLLADEVAQEEAPQVQAIQIERDTFDAAVKAENVARVVAQGEAQELGFPEALDGVNSFLELQGEQASQDARNIRTGDLLAEEKVGGVEKLKYIMKTGASSSILGMMYNRKLPGYDPLYEEQLTTVEKFQRAAVSMVFDLPAILTGAALPKYVGMASATLRSFPLLSRMFPTIPGAMETMLPATAQLYSQLAPVASAGAFSMGARRFLMDAYENDVMEDPRGILERTNRILKDALTGGTIGMISGKMQVDRYGAIKKTLLEKGGLDKAIFAKIAGSMAVEEIATAGLIANSEMRLPTKDDFIQAAVFGLGLNVVGVYRAPAYIKQELMFRKLGGAYTEYGIHPKTVVADALKYKDVADDLLNPATQRIRRYEQSGFNPEPEFYEGSRAIRILEDGILEQRKAMGITDPEQLYWDGDVLMQRMTVLKDLEAAGDEAAVPATRGILGPGEIIPRDDSGAATIPTQSFRMIDGTEIELPIFREHSNASMNISMFRNVDLVRFTKDLTGGKVPEVADLGDTLWGYYQTPKMVFDEEVSSLVRKLRARSVPKVVKDGLRQKLKELREGEALYAADPGNSRIVLNRSLFTDPAKVRETLTHEIGHFADWFGGAKVNQFENPLLDNIIGLNQGVVKAMENAVRVHGFDADLINDQAFALSMLWRPESIQQMSPSRMQYRMANKAELYADIVSLMIHNPQVVKNHAPEVFRAWETYLDNRPAIRDRFEQMIVEVHAGNNLEMASSEIRQSMQEADSRYVEQLQGSEARQAYAEQADADTLWMNWKDRMAPIRRRFGKTSPEIINSVQKFQGITTPMANLTHRVNTEVIDYAAKRGVSYDDLREVMLHQLVVKDARMKDLPNPMGLDRESSSAMLAAFDAKYGVGAVDDISAKFWKVRGETIVKRIKESGLFSEAYLDVVMNSPHYVHRRLTEFMDELGPEYTGMSKGFKGIESELEGARKIRKGSLKDIADPLAATLMNDTRLLYYIEKTAAVRDVTQAMRSRYLKFVDQYKGSNLDEVRFPDDVDMVLTKDGYTRLVDPEALGHDILNSFMDKRGMVPGDFEKVSFPVQEMGKDKKMHTVRKEYYIPKVVHDAFNANTIQNRMLNKYILDPTRATNRFFRLMVIGANASFLTTNFLIHDPGRTVFNMPGTGGAFDVAGNSINLAKNYGKTVKSMYKEMYKGELDPIYQDMLEKSIISQGMRFVGDTTAASLMDHQLERFMLDPLGKAQEAAQQRGAAAVYNRGYDKVENFFFGIADLTERLGNESAYRLIKDSQTKLGLSDATVEIIARTELGSPAYMVKGVNNNITNTLLPFFNATVQGITGDIDAARRMGKTSFTLKVVQMGLGPGIMAGLLEAGAFDGIFDDGSGETQSHRQAHQTSYKKYNSFNVAIGADENGEMGFLRARIPRHAAIMAPYALGRNIGKAAWEAAQGGDKDGLEIVKEFGSEALKSTGVFLESQIVSPAPLVTAARGAAKMATGQGKEVFGDSKWDKMKARPVSYGAPAMAALTAKSFGVNKGIEALLSPEPRDSMANRTYWQNMLQTPFVGPAMSSFFDHTSRGLEEEVARANAEERVVAAGETFDLERGLSHFFATGSADKLPEGYDQNRAKRVFKKLNAGRTKNVYVKNYLKARGSGGKAVAFTRLIESAYWKNLWNEEEDDSISRNTDN